MRAYNKLTGSLVCISVIAVCAESIAQIEQRVRSCGTTTPEPSVVANVLEQIAPAYFASLMYVANLRASAYRIEIPVYFHIITDGPAGAVSDEQVTAQLNVLNATFGQFGFLFVEAGRQTIDRPEWFVLDPNSPAENEAKRELGVDPDTTLNFYIADLSRHLGYARWPWELAQMPALDGVVVWHGSLPDSRLIRDEYNAFGLGMTGVHEVGHWLGLLHTFDSVDPDKISGCTPGDEVDDTAAEDFEYLGPGDAVTACPVTRDTCPAMPGYDPVDNFMDYSDDRCMTHFTVGQGERMMQMVQTYRPELLSSNELRAVFQALDELER